MSIQRLRSTWERLGQDDPLWAVLTDPDRKGGRWDIDEFLSTGEHWMHGIVTMLDESGSSLGDRVLDFGCGVGRLSHALAEHAREVVGIDIAASMIDNANRINKNPERVRFVHYDGQLLPFDDGSFDSAVSLIVLQHAPPAVQLACLVELQRVVRPGGVLVLQIPTEPRLPVPLAREGMRARLAVRNLPDTMPAGHSEIIDIQVTNVGAVPWPTGSSIKVGNHWLVDDRIVVMDDGRTELPGRIACGETFQVRLAVTAPVQPGRFELEIDLVQESVAWWGNVGSETVRLPVEVVAVPDEPAADGTAAASGGYQVAMEMHGVPISLVRAVFAHCRCTVMNVVPDGMAGEQWESMTYLIRKDKPAT